MASRDARLETRRRTPGPSDRSSAPPNDDAPSDDDAPPEGPRASRGEPAGDPDPDPDPTSTALAAARDPSALAVASASSLPSSPSAEAASSPASSSLSLREQKLKLAATSRRVATLRKKLDDIPSPLETAQYERRIAELHALARRRHAEHREAFEDYNALCDELETLRKELGILDSLRSQLGLLSLEPPGPGGDRGDDFARVPAGWTIDAETREAVARSLLSVESGVGRATAAARARARRAGEGLREARRRVREAEAAERKYLETLRA